MFCNKKRDCLKALHFEGGNGWLLEGLSMEQKYVHKPVKIQPEDTCF
ncbi:transposase [Schaedlerella arabinosiphila]|uniref:Transposase n=1 Tax=Schaedlerella arabinosiphila TaxID=2044587 RepID=A0A9X5CEQ4_9FIRM|nr:hypothetical protein [Schaedlerella arabinosiphila]NDO70131.1 transposase [Schaedlerella arabinosiphila]